MRSLASCRLGPFAAAMYLLLLLAPSSANASTVMPTVLDVAQINATIFVPSAIDGSWAFLLRKRPYELAFDGTYDCDNPPSIANTDKRTKLVFSTTSRRFRFYIKYLEPDVYVVCHRNATSQAGTYVPIASITVIRSKGCAGGKFGVCAVAPGIVSNTKGNTTLTLTGAVPGARAFLMIRKYMDRFLFNCSSPPFLETRLRSRSVRVQKNGLLVVNVQGLVPGNYVVCYLNTTAATVPSTMRYASLSQSVTVAGEIDAGRSSVCCAGPITAGVRAYCTISTFDSVGNPTGAGDDACLLNVCPLTDGKGADITDFTKPVFVSTGQYEFSFVPKGSGCQGSAAVAYKGYSLGNKVNYFSVSPGTPLKSKSEATCSYSQGVSTCSVTLKDIFDNPAKRCSVKSNGKIYCNMLKTGG